MSLVTFLKTYSIKWEENIKTWKIAIVTPNNNSHSLSPYPFFVSFYSYCSCSSLQILIMENVTAVHTATMWHNIHIYQEYNNICICKLYADQTETNQPLFLFTQKRLYKFNKYRPQNFQVKIWVWTAKKQSIYPEHTK